VRASLAGIVILATVATVTSFDTWLGLIAALLLLSACTDVLLPTRFTLTEQGVQIDNPFKRAYRTWDRFGAWTRTGDGFQLEGSARSKILRRRATVVLRCPERIDEVESCLLTQLDSEAGS